MSLSAAAFSIQHLDQQLQLHQHFACGQLSLRPTRHAPRHLLSTLWHPQEPQEQTDQQAKAAQADSSDSSKEFSNSWAYAASIRDGGG